MENAKKTKYFLTEGIADDREARDYQICSNMRGFKPRISNRAYYKYIGR